jgi:hypothetical protein
MKAKLWGWTFPPEQDTQTLFASLHSVLTRKLTFDGPAPQPGGEVLFVTYATEIRVHLNIDEPLGSGNRPNLVGPKVEVIGLQWYKSG